MAYIAWEGETDLGSTGQRPYFLFAHIQSRDDKYDILKHPNVALTTDGKAAPYLHGGTENAVATVSFADLKELPAAAYEEAESQYDLLSDEELEEILFIQEEKTNEKKQKQ